MVSQVEYVIYESNTTCSCEFGRVYDGFDFLILSRHDCVVDLSSIFLLWFCFSRALPGASLTYFYRGFLVLFFCVLETSTSLYISEVRCELCI